MESVLTATEKQSMVTSFLEIAAGQSAETARQFLQATSWQLEEAIQLFYVGHEDGGGPPAPDIPSLADDSQRARHEHSIIQNSVEVVEGDDVRPPLPVRREVLYDASTLYGATTGPHEANSRIAFRNFEEESDQRCVWESDQSASSSAKEASRDNLASLYRPPFALMYRGSFDKAKVDASIQAKWLLVNLQSTKEFSSHMLNRDTWANDAVAQTIVNNFIFWQAYDDTSEGRKVCIYYNLQSIPVILVIDPITGQKMRSWIGMVEPECFLEDLLPFLDHGPRTHCGIQSYKRPKGSLQDSVIHSQKIMEDDEELQLALAVSIEDQGTVNSCHVDREEFSKQSGETATSCGRNPAYPSLPEEPKGDGKHICRVGIRFPDGRRLQRNFLQTDPIQLLWAFCSSQLGEELRPFRLTQAIPGASKNLQYECNLTFGESGLANSMISLTWE